MFRTTLKSLWAHKRRLLSTALAVLLGVAFMTGTFVLSATLDKAFSDLFAESNAEISTVVRGPELFRSEMGGGTLRSRMPADVVDRATAVDGVEVAEPYVWSFTGAILTKDGDALGGQGPPTIFQSWITDDPMNALQIDEGRAPEGPGEMALNRTAVEDGGYEVGDEVRLLTQGGREAFELVGITTYGDAGSQGGATTAEFTLEEVQRISGVDDGRIDWVLVRSDGSVTDEELTERVAEATDADFSVVTGEAAAEELAADISEGFGFLTQMLLVFAGIALFVGTFIISNTFSILLAQRTKELALLRAIGATRAQVLRSVLLEALLVGIVAALIGIGLGVLLAIGALGALAAFGLELPGDQVVIGIDTIAISVTVGLVVTIGAALLPAIRSTRVPPIAALRDVAIDRSSRSWLRVGIAVVLLLLGFLQAAPAFGDSIERSDLLPIGLGAVTILLAVLAAGPVLAKPLSAAVSWWIPKVRGVPGQLATENAKRNPARTASTSTALAIGITLVGFITIFGASTRASISTDVERAFQGDFIVQAPGAFFPRLSPSLTDELAAIDGVDVASPFTQVEAQGVLPDGDEANLMVSAIDPPSLAQTFALRAGTGDVGDLAPGELFVDQQVASERDVAVGDEIELLLPGGERQTFAIAGLSNEPALLGDWVMTQADYRALSPEPLDFYIYLKLDEGADLEEMRVTLRDALEDYPIAAIQDKEQFIGSLLALINQFLVIIYALLALSVVIALIGIANTLSLSIHERTRELGLLRAVGMTRAQLRSTVRWEAVIVALIGTAIGLVLSVVLSWLIVRGLAPYGLGTFSIPYGQMLTVVVLGAVLGVLAALRPARRAARLNVLDAISSE